MDDRQLFAYENPLTSTHHWALDRGYHRLIALKGSFAHSMLVVYGGIDGERPCWFALLMPCEDLAPIAVSSLTVEQVWDLEDYARELLKGVGQNEKLITRDCVYMFKELTDEELAELSVEAKMPAGRAVTKLSVATGPQ